MLKVGTNFSGIGSSETALKNLKINHINKWACDIDKYAKEIYLKNHTCEIYYDDITKIDMGNLEYVDLYQFSFPCQDLSTAGIQNLSKNRSSLVNYSLDIVDKILPKYILFENVNGLLNTKFTKFYNYIVDRITKNYNYHLYRLNSKNFNIGHCRPRIFGVGIRKDIDENKNVNNFSFETKTTHFKDILEENPNEKYFLSKERTNKIIEIAKLKQKNFELKSNYGEINQANKTSIFGDKKIRYTGNSYCFNCIDIHGFIYPDNQTMRMFTPRECFRLQGFPDYFIIHEKDRIAYKQAGNTITVNVLEAIFKNLLKEYIK